MKYKCPVCGYKGLLEEPYNKYNYGSFEICVCCGFQFGLDDYPDKHIGITNWRKNWVERGCIWFSKSTLQPQKWEPKKLLADIELEK